MSTAHDLEKLVRAVGDVTCLVSVAADLAESIDAGDHGRTHVLAAVLRALRVQARAAFDLADAQWMDAHRAATATTTPEQGA
ncbi:hypothetical protein Lcho_3474 [Leptothrix cholodnii SP-6]|uniref:Uncharacterized protein n=1 Tax=Leptothrix cholodnii (strain ATCC 51168 / LMG 8142 / SP-6) TaxID=395495 RepID=B1Y3M7_LEPCP|nr:hypothetical protein [Leptothrix cholodnii]ACB35730.1 hypothetical protein Lcho_3474 [Leptothrix cholodnii SP-6]